MSEESTANNPTNLVERIRQWPRSRQISLALVGAISLAAFAVIILQAQQEPYKVLYGDLSQEEAASVVERLENEGVPYELREEGRTVAVPAREVHSTRLMLAGSGIPQGQGMGFEIFDEQEFGVTQFTQEINYQRALQGELARTISSLEPVQSSRIHLVLPEERLLQEQQRETKASVMVDLKHNQNLDQRQVQGIVHLVSGSIEGLDQNHVTIVDDRGQTLTDAGSEMDSPMSPDKLDYKQSVQEQMEEKAQSLLDRVYGPGSSVVRVTADLDFSQQHTTEEIFDPANVVPRSEREISEETGMVEEGGVPGVEANLGEEEEARMLAQPSSRSEDVINYEIGKRVEETTHPMGELENVSVSVLVAEDGGAEQPGGAEMGEQDLQAVEGMVSRALGLNEARGDRIEVTSMPFREGVFQEEVVEMEEAAVTFPYFQLFKYGAIIVALLLLYLFLVRPLIRVLQTESQEHRKPLHELEAEQQAKQIPSNQPIEQMRQEISQSQVSPAQVVKAWIKEG